MVLAPPGSGSMRLIDEVSDEYKRRFNQESVLRVVEGHLRFVLLIRHEGATPIPTPTLTLTRTTPTPTENATRRFGAPCLNAAC